MPRTIAVDTAKWEDFLASWEWKQGQHITLIGPTDAGKTTLAMELLKRRDWVVVLGCKKEDPTLSAMKRQGYVRTEQWPPLPYQQRVLFWPRINRQEDLLKQKIAFRRLLGDVMQSGRWCVYLDELWWVAHYLKLGAHVEPLWFQGRTMKLSLVAGMQRPAWVPLAAYDQIHHMFLWRDSDERNIRRVTEMGTGVSAWAIRQTLQEIGEHDVLYVHTRKKEMVITNVFGGRE